MPQPTRKSVFVLAGQDDHLRRLRRRQVLAKIFGDHPPAVTELTGSAELSAVLDELRTASLLAAASVVVVEGAEPFVTRHAAALERYLASPSSSGTLILIVDEWPPKPPAADAPAADAAARQRKKEAADALAALVKAVEAGGAVIPCLAPPAAALPKWIAQAAAQRGKKITTDAARLLADWIGPDLARLDSEVEKLSLYAGSREALNAADVAAVVAASPGVGPFALTNALERGQLKQALEALAATLATRGEEFRLMSVLVWFLRSRRQKNAGYGRRTPGAGPAQLRRKVEIDLRRVLAADLAIKTGADRAATLQILVVKLCGY